MSTFKVAIDGPSGAGKSTIAKVVSKKLGFTYIDTGAMYRAIGLYVIKNGASTQDEAGVAALLCDIDIDIKHTCGEQHIYLCGDDVSGDIRKPEISMAASDVGKILQVREKLTSMQKVLAEKYDVIMDGRDIGTFVLPFADVKIFLTASVKERAKRRYDELLQKGENVTLRDVEDDIKKRDFNDSNRKISPLKKAEDAIELDTSDMSLEDSIDAVYKIICERRQNHAL